MGSAAASLVGSIPKHYDRGLGPLLFADYAADIARRTQARSPVRVLETAAGTGIVIRELRDLLPASVQLVATDLNPPMLDVARTKFRSGEKVAFQHADAAALPFPNASFDAVVCQFGVMFFPEKDKSYREVHRVLVPGNKFAISCRAEAEAYLKHPILGPRLRDCTALVVQIEGRSIDQIFGYPDNLKFRSSMTLFTHATVDNQLFESALRKYFGGEPDPLTLERL